MAVISTGNHPKALWPGVHAWFGKNYNELPVQCSQVFDVKKSKKSREEDVEQYSFGLAPVKSEGAATSYDSQTQGPTTTYNHIAYALGYIVTREERDDNLYAEVSMKRAASLAFSMRQTKEVIAANVFNRGFNSSYTGGDGKEMLATDHVTQDGTQSNELAVAADLSEASLEDGLTMVMNSTNSRGLRISLSAQKLIVPPALAFDATRIVKSNLQNDTANNATNAVRSMGLLPQGIMVWNYLTDTNAWFLKTNAPDGLNMFMRQNIEFSKDKDFDTDNAKAKAYERYSIGWTDWRSVFGSAGA